MKRNKIIYNRWLRTLFLSFALLIGGGWMAWGQTVKGPVTDESKRPKIILKNDVTTIDGKEYHRHDSVFYETKTIYALQGKKRKLFIPELRTNIRGGKDEEYNWFVHWYVVDHDGNVVDREEAGIEFKFETETFNEELSVLQGGYWGGYIKNPSNNNINEERNAKGNKEGRHTSEDFFVSALTDDGGRYGWVWSKRLRKEVFGHDNIYGGGYGMDASTIYFRCENFNYDIYCDVSIYQDGIWKKTENETNGTIGEYTEPTLTKRYKFRLENAENLNFDENDPEVFEYDYPYDATGKNNTINFSMPYMPDNYFWKENEEWKIGQKFEYQYQDIGDGTWYAFRLATRGNQRIPLQQVQRIVKDEAYLATSPIHIKVRVSSADVRMDNIEKFDNDQDASTKVVAEYFFYPQPDAGFRLDDDALKNDPTRWPRRDTVKYRQIGHVSFDNEAREPGKVTTLVGFGSEESANNMSSTPFGYYKDNQTSYGFLQKEAYTLLFPRTDYGDNASKTNNQNIYGLFRSANVDNVSKAVCYEGKNDNISWKRVYVWPGGKSNQPLYDRTYEITKETDEKHYGYFYYIDASNDAGTLVDVPVDNICSNTELTVTAWVADMTRIGKSGEYYPLAPNINLLFKGVDSEGNEQVLHRFTSCDALVDNKNENGIQYKDNGYIHQWQQLCYSFVVDEPLDGYKSFHLEIQNNEPHTDGADYAIDDIRVFVRKPQVSIMQAGDLCDTELKKVRFGTDYSNILQTMGLTPEQAIPEGSMHRDVDWDDELPEELRTFMTNKYGDKAETEFENYFTKIYYSIYKVKEDGTLEDEPLKIDYHGNGKKEYSRQSYVSTRIEDMKWSDPNFDTDNPIIHSLELEIGSYFEANTDYIARVSSQPLGEDGESLACGTCALVGDVFRVSVTGDRFTIIKSGETELIKPDNVEQGKTYSISGVFKYRKKDNGPLITLENAQFDWFIGTFDEFYTSTVTVDNKDYTIQEAFRIISQGESDAEAIQNALQAYDKDSNSTGQYVFGKSGFDYKMENKYQSIIGLPRANQKDENNDEIKPNLYCTDPVLIPLGGTPPTIDPGDPDVPDPDPKDPEDPKDPDPKDPDPENPDDPDTPKPDKDPVDGSHVRSVRVGLVQIQDMVKENHNGTLRIPIHARTSEEGEKFVINETNTSIKVIETSDNDRRKGLIDKQVATLTVLEDVYVNMDENKPKWNENYFKIQFNEEAVNSTTGFREGFWYMVEIPYAVKDNNGSVVYHSSMKLTLKIVPEYVTWVGSTDGMHNWNNDGPNHWRRSTDGELYTTNVASQNGPHTEAYTPMRFTKVTIYGKAQDKTNSYAANGNAYAAYPHLYELSKQTSGYILDMAPTAMDNTIGAATKNIEYDLLADPDYEKELFGSTNPDKPTTSDNHNYSCVCFYGNTCNEIYIKPESEILHTEFLTYNKAHVDYEMSPNRWYMLASPLKGVVSGDMYLPTGTGVGKYARQETPAFGEINYNTTDYTRWKPAVYMRGWKKAVSVVYPNTVGKPTEYGIATNWSNLYNDVDVPFTPGTGFSIGTNANSDFSGKVLFRLPKNDDSYNYYVKDEDKTDDNKELTKANRNGNGRFIISPNEEGKDPVVSYNVETTEMFGNPFMSHLDMTKFFSTGQGTYYILSESGTETDILLGNGYSISTEKSDPKYVAPLQSFIVPNMASATFITDMIAKAPTGNGLDNGLRSATTAPVEEPLPQLRITATRDGVRNTAVVAGLVTASDSYVEGEDAALLINEEVAAPQVYTLAGNQMTAINVTPDLNEIPLGIYGKDANPVELSFKVSGAMKNVKLVDKQTGKHYDVSDGLTLTVPGNTSGRYFLNGSIATSNEIIAQGRIIFYNSAPGRIDISSVDPLSEVTVYDIAGRALRTLRNLNTPTASVDHLAPGIYVVRAESGSQTVSEKVEVK